MLSKRPVDCNKKRRTKLPVIIDPMHDNGQERVAIAWGPRVERDADVRIKILKIVIDNN